MSPNSPTPFELVRVLIAFGVVIESDQEAEKALGYAEYFARFLSPQELEAVKEEVRVLVARHDRSLDPQGPE